MNQIHPTGDESNNYKYGFRNEIRRIPYQKKETLGPLKPHSLLANEKRVLLNARAKVKALQKKTRNIRKSLPSYLRYGQG